MAIVCLQSTVILGGVAGEAMQAGRAVVLQSGSLLPTAQLAPANARNVFIVAVPPDPFSRPTPLSMFQYRPYALGIANAHPNANTQFHPTFATPRVIDNETYVLMSPSLVPNFTIPANWRVQLHRGGAYLIPSGAFVDSPSIRQRGATVAVTTSGRFTYSTTNVVGTVIDVQSDGIVILLDAVQG